MTGADHFSEILRQVTLIVADTPESERPLVTLQYVMGATIGTAVSCYEHHAYAEAQDLITLCARMVNDANERIVATHPEAQDFIARSMARLAGVAIPEPKIAEADRDDLAAEKAWAEEILNLANTSPDKSMWLHVSDRCCFGGSVEACGRPIDGVQLIASGEWISAVCYCEKHGTIMADVIAEQRAKNGSMTTEEIDRMSELR